jgi:hypothetical protein
MNDTPEHIKQIQLKLWLSKPSGERLLQFIQDNELMLKALKEVKEKKPANKNNQ